MNRLKHILMLVFLLMAFNLGAEEVVKFKEVGILYGKVTEPNGDPVSYATVSIEGTNLGTSTAVDGTYRLVHIPDGKMVVIVRCVGYETVRQEVVISSNGETAKDFVMNEKGIVLDDVVVTANRSETTRRMAPTLVTVIDKEIFHKTQSTRLSEGLKFQPGIRVENNCQNCGFNQVRINGLDGPYSQILIDSRPVYSSLAGIYGLEQIPADMIERVEVIRGGGSALFGSSAIGGSINIITKDPLRNSASVAYNTNVYSAKGNSKMENTLDFNASMITPSGRAGVMTSGHFSYRPGFDKDGDTYTDIPQLRSRSFGFRSFFKASPYDKVTAEYHNIHEYRRGGNKLEDPAFVANITEFLQHFINSGSLRYDHFSRNGKNHLSLYTAMSNVSRLSYYGGGDSLTPEALEEIDNLDDMRELVNGRLIAYGTNKSFDYQVGGQFVHKFDRFIFMPADLTLGLESFGEKLGESGGARVGGIDQVSRTQSAFLQNEWKNETFSLLLGGRMDHVNLNKGAKDNKDVRLTIFSPRVNVRYNPAEALNFRLSYSQGFRAPQFFDEELHVALAGGDPIVRYLDENLKEERSHSVSLSADTYFNFGHMQLNLLAEGFYTILRDAFDAVQSTVDEGTPNERQIVTVTNHGKATVKGVNLEARLAHGKDFSLQAGMTFQSSRYDEKRNPFDDENSDNETDHFLRAPDVYGYFVAEYRPISSIRLNLSGNYTGKMYVPHTFTLESKEDWEENPYKDYLASENTLNYVGNFFDINASIAYQLPFKSSSVRSEIFFGVNNIFDSFQKDLDRGPDRASDYVYGPMLPRRFSAGLRVTL